MAETSLEVRSTSCSTSSSEFHLLRQSQIMGNHSGLGQQLHPALPHGEEDPIQRNWTPRCYFLRRNNLGEPQRSYALNAIDRAIKFWQAKPVRRPVPLRAPWLLPPTWRKDLKSLLTAHVHTMKPHNVSLQSPSMAIVFTKYPSVMDSLCNHKDMATRWADREQPTCICTALQQHLPHPHPEGQRYPDIFRPPTHLHRRGISTKQDLSTEEGNLEVTGRRHYFLAQEEFHAFHPTTTP